MEFEWDEAKRALNLSKHGLDLKDGQLLFDGRPALSYPSPRFGELRHVTIGQVDQRMVALVWVIRDGVIRLISLRSARDAEKREYRARHG